MDECFGGNCLLQKWFAQPVTFFALILLDIKDSLFVYTFQEIYQKV